MSVETFISGEKKRIVPPVLMKQKNSSLIVFFTKETSGVVVHSDDTNRVQAGYEGNQWPSCYYNSKWELFEGEVVIKNK